MNNDGSASPIADNTTYKSELHIVNRMNNGMDEVLNSTPESQKQRSRFFHN